MDRLNNSFNNHTYIKNRKQQRLVYRNNFLLIINTSKKAIKLEFLKKKFALIMICLMKKLHNNYLFVYLFLDTTPYIFVK